MTLSTPQKTGQAVGPSAFISNAIAYAAVGLVFALGLWLVVIKPLGPGLSLVPGDLGDTRFNSVILEHFYRWVSGLEKNYWNATFFYPFPLVTAFSDNLLGSAPFYALFRWAGADRETALQAWYILGFCLNYAAAAYVLARSRFSTLAVAAGAFFFTFGLPLLAQEGHIQLLYRFGVPLAGYFLWRWAQKPTFKHLALFVFFLVYQFFLSIYTGYFLLLFLGVLALLIPFGFLPPSGARAAASCFLFWPRRIRQTWSNTHTRGRLLGSLVIAALLAALVALFLPYFKVTDLYGFKREWSEITRMLPRPRSYFLADRSLIWQSFSAQFGDILLRGEHQLFPGGAVILSLILGAAWRFRSENRKSAFFNLAAVLLLIAGTLQFRGHSLYELIWWLPGINSIRAVTRIHLVLMWPLAFFTAYSLDALFTAAGRGKWLRALAAWLLLALLVCESVFFIHMGFSKQAAQDRLARLNNRLPADIPAQPILFVAANPDEPYWASEIDAMLVAQQHGWATLNGYSGNFPPGHEPAHRCAQIPQQIIHYLQSTHQSDQATYLGYIKRIVPVGFTDCDPAWWRESPRITQYPGAFPPDLLSQIAIEAVSLSTSGQKLTASITIRNNSTQPLPAESATGSPFRVVYLPVNSDTGQLMIDYEFKQALTLDLQPADSVVVTVDIEAPKEAGRYTVAAWPSQQGFSSRPESAAGLTAAPQTILVDQNHHFSLVDR